MSGDSFKALHTSELLFATAVNSKQLIMNYFMQVDITILKRTIHNNVPQLYLITAKLYFS